jgi:acetyl esterase
MSIPTMAPEYQAMSAAVAENPSMSSLEPDAARALWAAFQVGEREPIGEIRDLAYPGAETPLGARLYRPEGNPLAVVLYIHGGGWVLGDIETHDVAMTGLVRRSDCAVVSINYRLAPESPFPGGLEDCYAALQWLETNGAELGLSGVPLVVSGDSAGGNLAAALCILARNRAGPIIDGQLLLYPVTDGRRASPSYTERGNGGLLSASDMEWFWNHYASSRDALSALASPLLCEELNDLPPAVIVTAEFDPLRDEARDYAERLKQADVRCATLHFADLPHGFLTSYQIAPASDQALTGIAEALRELVKTV